MTFAAFLRSLRNSRSIRDAHLLRVEVSRLALAHNARTLKQLIGGRSLAVVLKSNAYGHGLREVGKIADELDSIDCLVVDSIVEARMLRGIGVRKPILIIGYVPKSRLQELTRLRSVTLVVTSLDQVRDVVRLVHRPLSVHIKVDTGMHRQGIAPDQLLETIAVLRTNKSLHLTGLATHFADADGADETMTMDQIRVWNGVVEIYRKHVGEGEFHVSATAGTQFVEETTASLVRLGIGFYGLDSVRDRSLDLKPALSVWAKITSVKHVYVGDSVGYNATYTATSERTIALIPCGYNEGVDRALSNRGTVFFGSAACPIVGRVSMNMTSIDVTDVSGGVQLEDEVEVISEDRGKANSVEAIAALCDTIPYEVLVRISPSLKRWIV
ncbi:alanine racemase [Candidatus Uhrbacteria bacterium CG10_big_fil_rev_8_21_14_0_10_50_16]|uniref:Alanine racemase n=1 Tax=Candidatus Uhrbacteria bacterium CG10_big_fil_rev_8_21_14_0_10_50_16 TaxID=1975039 RepID=A0A2H0RLZ5_9BACT|nr:MAG: alanine racemase [Candidatus Uhrbacteria bacterium CG10_big_fil_rev_8_21_14_0_10_50_16]